MKNVYLFKIKNLKKMIASIIALSFLSQNIVLAGDYTVSNYKIAARSRWSSYWNDPKHQLDEKAIDGFIYATSKLEHKIEEYLAKGNVKDPKFHRAILDSIDEINKDLKRLGYYLSIVKPNSEIPIVPLLKKYKRRKKDKNLITLPYLIFKAGEESPRELKVVFNLDPEKLSQEALSEIGIRNIKDLAWLKVPGTEKVWIADINRTKDMVKDEEFISRLMPLLQGFRLDDLKEGISVLLREEFADKVIFYDGPSIQGSFKDSTYQKVSFEIAIPVLQRKFLITYTASDTEPLIESDGECIPLKDFLPRIREMISSPEYLETSGRAEKDLLLRLKIAIWAKDDVEILKVLKLLLDNSSEKYLAGIIDAFKPIYDATWETHSLTASDNIYSRVTYIVSLMMSKFGYDLCQEGYYEILKAMDQNKGIDSIRYNGSFYTGRYVFENKIAVKTSDENRKAILEYFIFRNPEGDEEKYTFTANELAESLNINLGIVEKIIQTLIDEGRVVENENGSYTTDSTNIFCATDLYQAVISDMLAGRYGRALYELQYIPDLRVLDYAYQNMANAEAANVVRRSAWNIKNRQTLAGVVKKHYQRIKDLIMNELYSNQVALFLVVSLGRARYMDNELSEFLYNAYSKADKKHWVTKDIEYVLKECGKLIDGPDVLESANARLLIIGNIHEIFTQDIIDKIGKMAELLKRLDGIDIHAEDLNEAEELAIALFNAHLSEGKPEITDVLKLFLSKLVEIAQKKYEIYRQMGGSLYRTITWDRFQRFYNFLKTLRARMLEEVREKGQIAGLLAPITGLMQDTGDTGTALALPRETGLVRAKSFADRYKETLDTDSLIAMLLQQYPMDGVKVDVKTSPAMFQSTHAEVKGIGEKHYQINLFNAHGEYLQYLLFHEFMHIYLWEKGLIYGWDISDTQISKYLFLLKNMIEDYLIEKENKRVFGSTYSGITRELRDTDLIGNIQGAGMADNIDIIMLALTCKFTVMLYPELADSTSARLVGEGIKFDGLGEVISILGRLSIGSSFEDYTQAIIRIHQLLTEGKAAFSGKTISVDFESLREFFRYMNETMSQIIRALRRRDGYPEGSPANFFRILTQSGPENVDNKVSPEFKRIIDNLKNKKIKAGQVFELTQKPNRAELQLITTIGETEVALLHLPDGDRWFIVKGEQDHPVVDNKLEKAADLFAHYHPPETYCADLPSFQDAFIATTSGKDEFILHADGITYFKGIKTDPISGEAWIPRKSGEVEGKFFAFIETQERTKSFKEYTDMVRRFFEKMGVDPKTKKWEELKNEEVFEQFLQHKVPIEKLRSDTGISADTIERDMRILRKAKLVIRENTDGKITFKINPAIARSPEKIKIAQDILDSEYKEGQIAYKSKTKAERERIVARLISSVWDIHEDAENTKKLLDEIIPTEVMENRSYVIRYDAERLSQTQQDIIDAYVEILRRRIPSTDDIRVIKFTKAKRDYIIKVECKDANQKILGEGRVDVKLEGKLEEYPLRIIGILNMAFASANVPDNLADEQIKDYKSLIEFIQMQYRTIKGAELVIPDSAKGILDVIRRIELDLPKIEKIPIDKADELNRLAKQLLISA